MVALEAPPERFSRRADFHVPPTLRAGDRMRVVSPSFCELGINTRRRDRAVAAFESVGLELVFSERATLVNGHVAGTVAQRADDINESFADPDVHAVICAVGGGNSADLLPLLDLDVIAANPKPFMGHSDNGSLLLGVFAATGLVTFHGTAAMKLGEYPEPFPEMVEQFRDVVMEQRVDRFEPIGSRCGEPLSWFREPRRPPTRQRRIAGGWQWARPGRATGPLIGGTLPTLANLAGTEWFPDLDEFILFTDGHFIDTVYMDASFSILQRCGILERCTGLVLGEPKAVVTLPGAACYDEVVAKWVRHIDGPVLTGADCGDTDPSWILPIGVTATLDSESDRLEIDWTSPR